MPTTKRGPSPALGGPGTLLPRPVESLLSWSLCVSCLSISGYHYVVAAFVAPALTRWRSVARRAMTALSLGLYNRERLGRSEAGDDIDGETRSSPSFERAWIPLTICSRSEMDRFTPRQRLEQLAVALGRLLVQGPLERCDDAELVSAIRSDEACRRLASLVMRPYRSAVSSETDDTNHASNNGTVSMVTLLDDFPHLDLPQRLARVWPDLLALPPLLPPSEQNKNDQSRYLYQISLVVPAFRENGSEVSQKLSRALRLCVNPHQVEVVLVDAGGCTGLQEAICSIQLLPDSQRPSTEKVKRWGDIRCVEFTSGGGRGPCLNFGAKEASGRALTFCHSDTALPEGWDSGILRTLFPAESSSRADNGGEHLHSMCRANACAFHFGIDATPVGLSGGPYPPGIRAVETTANLRTRLYSLPYGDQCISVPSDVFHYVGGFPDQCLFEDYELVALLRKRSALLPLLSPVLERESLKIIDGPPALCSPRRWQKYGVLYVTYMNSKFVNLYARGMHPDDIFRLYYGGDPPKRDTILSPWEAGFRI